MNSEHQKILKEYDEKVKALSEKDKDYFKKRNDLIMEVKKKLTDLIDKK